MKKYKEEKQVGIIYHFRKDIKNLDKLKKICEKENIKLTITNK